MSKAESNNEVKVYEIGYLVLPSIPEDKLQDVVSKVRGAVEKAGGTSLDGEEPFKIDLAYTMTKTVGASRYVVSEAYIGWMKCELEAAGAVVLKEALDGIDEILRFLLIKAPKESAFTFEKAHKAMMEKLAEEKGGEEAVEAPSASAEPVVE